MNEKPISVLIADDHPVFRSGLRSMLKSTDGFKVAGEAGTGREAVELVGELRPDVVLMDLKMPELDGIEATRQITDSGTETAVLTLTMFEDDDSVFASMRRVPAAICSRGASGRRSRERSRRSSPERRSSARRSRKG